MSTPRRNFNNYTSPYARPVQQYPSQSGDYLSLNAGGPGPAPQPRKFGRGNMNMRGRFSSTPAKHHKQNDYDTDRSNMTTDGSNNCYFYQDTQGNCAMPERSAQKRPYENNGRNNYNNRRNYRGGGGGGGGNGGGMRNMQPKFKSPATKEETFSMYFHASMLEDPWKELKERRNALRKSELQPQGRSDDQTGNSSNSDNENASDNDSS